LQERPFVLDLSVAAFTLAFGGYSKSAHDVLAIGSSTAANDLWHIHHYVCSV
jgi:hypothetical protein